MPSGIVINTIPERLKAFENALEAETSATLMALGEQIAGMVQKNTRNSGAVASGTLLGTIAPVHAGHTIVVGSPVEYGTFVELGTRPHFPPYEPIRQWVELKKSQFTVLSIGVSFESGRAVPTRRGTKRIPRNQEAAALDKIARAIQRSIARRGTKAKYVMRDALDELGLQYELVNDGGQMTYVVDVAGFLGPDFFDRVARRI